MRARAVIFDLDGTLLDTLADIAAAVNAALESIGAPTHAVQAYAGMVGYGLRETVSRALPPAAAADPQTVEQCMATMRAAYLAQPLEHTAPYPGIIELLHNIHARGVPMAVLSNKAHDLVTTIISGALPDIRFRDVRGTQPETPAKPDPASALEIASILGHKPNEIALVGDSEVDMQTAVNAEMAAVGVGWGFRTVEQLRHAGAQLIVMHPEEIVRILGESEE